MLYLFLSLLLLLGKCHSMREHKVKGVIWEGFALSGFMMTAARAPPMSSCESRKPCTPHRKTAAWWKAPITGASVGSGLLFAIRSIGAQALHFERLFLMMYWGEWRQTRQCHPPTGRTARRARANENRWGVCTYSNNKCSGSKSSLIASYIFLGAASDFFNQRRLPSNADFLSSVPDVFTSFLQLRLRQIFPPPQDTPPPPPLAYFSGSFFKLRIGWWGRWGSGGKKGTLSSQWEWHETTSQLLPAKGIFQLLSLFVPACCFAGVEAVFLHPPKEEVTTSGVTFCV